MLPYAGIPGKDRLLCPSDRKKPHELGGTTGEQGRSAEVGGRRVYKTTMSLGVPALLPHKAGS